MYSKDGENYFIVDGHVHFWDGGPANQANRYGTGFTACFYDYHRNLSPPEYVWPLEKFEKYSEDELLHDLFPFPGGLSGGGDVNNSVFGIKSGGPQSPQHSALAVRALADAERAMHKSDTLVPLLEQMSGGKFAPLHIVDSDRAKVLDAARAIQ